jgi:uncharacterized membrane protein
VEIIHLVSRVIGYLGVAVIAYGVVGGVVRLIASEIKPLRRRPVATLRSELREHLGYYLLLGLEFTIASDIIDTILSLEREALVNLAIVVAIRTVISFSLNWELAQHRRAVDP